MDQRMEFALKAVNCNNFRQLCRDYGISAKTGYKWQSALLGERLRRNAGGKPAAPEPCQRTAGARRVRYGAAQGGPSPLGATQDPRALRAQEATGGNAAQRKQLQARAGARGLDPAKAQALGQGRRTSVLGRKAQAPNEVWTVDFKGWWLSRDGLRVEPLTVRDEFSRMLLEMRAVESSRTEVIQPCFERLLSQYGLPEAIRSDNGPPFATSHGLLGLSRFSAWWLALGIDLERSRPGCPQDNGGHERMHLDVRRELQAGRVGRDQEAFDLWRHEYNYERPHEALAMACPADVYRPSERRYEGTPEVLDYHGTDIRRVSLRGNIRYQSAMVFLSSALAGWDVGLAPRSDGLIEVWFANLLVGHLDPATASFTAARPGRSEAGDTNTPT